MPETVVDVERFYSCLDKKRMSQKLSWRTLARILQVPPSTFTRMAQGKRPDLDAFATLLNWLDMPADSFMRSRTKDKESSNSFVMISSYLRADKNLTPEAADALDDIIKAAYRGFIAKKEASEEE